MAKEESETKKSKKDTSTPYQKFEALAKRVIRVPKDQAVPKNNERPSQRHA